MPQLPPGRWETGHNLEMGHQPSWRRDAMVDAGVRAHSDGLLDAFELVKELGCRLPDVEAATKYDGSPVLKVHGVFMAGLAMHASAEPKTLVVRAEFDARDGLLEDAPETYYVTDYYRRYPVVLVRLSILEREALSELLAGSWRMAVAKHTKGRAMPTTR